MAANVVKLRQYRMAYTKRGEREVTASISADSYDRVKSIMINMAKVSSADDLEDWEIHDITDATTTGKVSVRSKSTTSSPLAFIHRFDIRKKLISYKVAKLVKKDEKANA